MRIVLGVLLAIVVLLALSQAILPGIATQRAREKVGRYGSVKSVNVKAWPAVKLLWGSADEVTVKANTLKLTPKQTADLLAEARGIARVKASVGSVKEGPLRLTDARFEKHKSSMRAQGVMSESDIRAALPPELSMTLLHSGQGTIVVRASGGLFGSGGSVEAIAKAQQGKLVVQPETRMLQGLKLTLFADPRVYIEGVEARRMKDASAPGTTYLLSMSASLR